MILDQIHSPADIKNLTIEELNTLADEIKVFLIESIMSEFITIFYEKY